MNTLYALEVKLGILGPLMTSGGGDTSRGWDQVFCRSANGKPVINGSHIKGKLKEALIELGKPQSDIGYLFGVAGVDPKDNMKKGALRFESFSQIDSSVIKILDKTSRTAIDKQTGTAKEKSLLSFEAIAKPGEKTLWKGTIEFWARDDSQAEKIKQIIEYGFKWLPAIGSTKGVGYGRIFSVQVNTFKKLTKVVFDKTPTDYRYLTLEFEFKDDLFVGGIVKKTNYLESETVIPGTVTKGAFARFLNELCGSPGEAAIDENNKVVMDHFPNVCTHFKEIRFLHAFPVLKTQSTRPVTVPKSTVEFDGGIFRDVTLANSADLIMNKKAPRFHVDWKGGDKIKKDFGWATCMTLNKTRTAIKRETRSALEEGLYTFQYLTAFDESGNPVKWTTGIIFPKLEDESQYKLLADEFLKAAKLGWTHLGKRDAQFQLAIRTQETELHIETAPAIPEKCIITLQTDALLFDARSLAQLGSALEMQKVYESYWKELFGDACILSNFYARQKMIGGFQAKRFRDRQKENYYPYVLTEAGSVFVLENVKVDALEELQKTGLPLPEQVAASLPENAYWQGCPFVPENGYGEFTVNLKWFTEKQLKM